MISALFISTVLATGPASPGELISNLRRTFIEDGVDRVSATATHRVISHADGSLELQGAQPLRLSLQSIRRESGASCATDFLSRVTALNEPNSVRTLHRCGVEESWTNEANGLAHAFTVLDAPPGAGGLTLRLAIEGPWHHHDERGHVFKGPGAAAALRYGQAFVVRDGQRLPISVLRVDGGLELKIPAALVEAPHAFPMHIDPLLSGEVELDPAQRYGASAGREEWPAVAVNSAGVALVVWSDTRRQLGTDLFGVRLSATGMVLDATGIPISLAAGLQLRPTLCADGTNFLVAWDTAARDGGLEVKARTVTSAGTLGNQFDVAPGSQPSLAATGDAGLLLLALVDPDDQLRVVPIIGNTPDLGLTQLVDSSDVVSRPSLAATHTGWFAAWESAMIAGGATSIRGIWSGGLPTPLILSSNTAANSAKHPSVALGKDEFGADEAFVVWNENLGGAKGARINQVGAILPLVVNGSSPAAVRTSSAVGAAPIVGSFVANRLQLKDLNDAGLTSVLVGTTAQDLALAVGTNSRLFAAWTESPVGGTDVHGTSILLPNTSAGPAILSRTALAQRSPRVAMSGANKEGLAVWVEGTDTILAAKVVDGVNGLQVNTPFQVAVSGLRVEQVDVAATLDDGKYLVTWRQVNSATMVSSIMAQLTGSSSTQGNPFVVSAAGVFAGPAVAWEQSGSNFIVLWNQLNNGLEMVTRTVTLNGVVSVERTHADAPAVEVAISCMRGECLFAWERPTQDIQAIVLGSFGSVVDLGPGRQPAATYDGSNFFLGWRKGLGLGFARLDYTSGQATPLPVGPTLSSSSAGVTQLSLAPGLPPVVAWSELSAMEESSVFLHRLDFNGQATSVGQGVLPVVSTSSVLAEPSGVVVYQRFAGDTRYSAMRSFAKSFSFAVDAGASDAGVDAGVDAGAGDGGADAGSDQMPEDGGVDGGASDAGLPDGGSGPMMFGTAGCNCGSASPVPLLCFALLVLRRRRQINAS